MSEADLGWNPEPCNSLPLVPFQTHLIYTLYDLPGVFKFVEHMCFLHCCTVVTYRGKWWFVHFRDWKIFLKPFLMLSMFTINLPLRQAREEQNYAPLSAKHVQNHFGIQGKCTPMGLTSLMKFSLLNNMKHCHVLWIKSALRTFLSWQPPRQQCGGCKE